MDGERASAAGAACISAHYDESNKVISQNLALSCPTCLTALAASTDGLNCSECSTHYPVTDGIADLRKGRKDYYFNPVARPAMREIIRDAEERNWPRAIRRFMAEVNYNPDWVDNLVADGRYAWKLFLALPPNARVLDLGCGLGNLTKNVAPHVGEMCALDLTWERLQFAQRRFALFNRDDRISLVAGGDGEHLPFADGTFDAVLISGVLEWVADDSTLWGDAPGRFGKAWRMLRAHFGRTNPRRVQLEFLREIRRVLKPAGMAFIGIENRLSHEYFSGRPDHHSGLLFGSLLPRGAATVYSIAKSRTPYRTFTYSHRGYSKLLGEAGFRASRFLGLTPGYSHLSRIIPFDDESGRWSQADAIGMKERIQESKLCVPAYGIVANAGASAGEGCNPSLIESVALEVERAVDASLRLSTLTIENDSVALARGTLDGRAVLLRMPLNDAAIAKEQANHEALRALAARNGALKDRVPAPITAGIVNGLHFFVEQTRAGAPMTRDALAGELAAMLEQVESALEQMNPELPARAPVRFGSELAQEEIDRPLARIAMAIEDCESVAALGKRIGTWLAGAEVRPGLVHGDLVPQKVLFEGGSFTGVVDWGNWSPARPPIVDAIRFVHGLLEMANPGRSPADTVAMLSDLAALGAEEREFLRRQYRRQGLDPARHAGFVYLAWVQQVATRIDALAVDPKRLDATVVQVLRRIAASLPA